MIIYIYVSDLVRMLNAYALSSVFSMISLFFNSVTKCTFVVCGYVSIDVQSGNKRDTQNKTSVSICIKEKCVLQIVTNYAEFSFFKRAMFSSRLLKILGILNVSWVP